MTELLNVQSDETQHVITLRDATGTFDIVLTTQSASVLIAALAQSIVDRAEPNRPGTEWLKWPTTARSGEVSFDIEPTAPGVIGIAIKLPGLMPIRIEIPPDSARQVAFALAEAADKSQIPETRGS